MSTEWGPWRVARVTSSLSALFGEREPVNWFVVLCGELFYSCVFVLLIHRHNWWFQLTRWLHFGSETLGSVFVLSHLFTDSLNWFSTDDLKFFIWIYQKFTHSLLNKWAIPSVLILNPSAEFYLQQLIVNILLDIKSCLISCQNVSEQCLNILLLHPELSRAYQISSSFHRPTGMLIISSSGYVF